MTVPASLATAPLCVILGPTASGKSALALALAERWGAEIVSIDSMQVYREMDIGTAKPTLDEQRRVRHHLIDVVDPNETFTVARFVEQADAVIADARRRAVPLVLTGGTPMYYKALFEGLFEGPSADPDLRMHLRSLPGEQLYDRLRKIDPAAAERIHANDTKRLVRAIEVFELTGRRISEMQTEWGGGARRHDAVWFGLHWERDALNRRINARARQMIDAGWVDETLRLRARWGVLSDTARMAAGYMTLLRHLDGKLALDDAIEQIKIDTRQLARRQIKWFRRWEGVTWLAGDASPDANIQLIEKLSTRR
ncbi:MAG TPA: tRNA (adenosine(37)-N6)-dimethylallyltransferase MiaA [Tepidisphaeraceae bacterium]|nr:tRNA (adenosine(37)-N6)-dimethylallyltransferase MiaA [Tepidisphaeraceae bacterium]